jgi:hypothetical protein
MARAGDLTFEPRIGNTLSAPAADFHDDGTNIPYDGVGITFEADSRSQSSGRTNPRQQHIRGR